MCEVEIMPFQKGKSGNIKGRPKMTAEEKEDKEIFIDMLKCSTVQALERIIEIASDNRNKDCFHANKYIIEKAYGRDMSFLEDENKTITINLVKHGLSGNSNNEKWGDDSFSEQAEQSVDTDEWSDTNDIDNWSDIEWD
jgi:hypothetical protein